MGPPFPKPANKQTSKYPWFLPLCLHPTGHRVPPLLPMVMLGTPPHPHDDPSPCLQSVPTLTDFLNSTNSSSDPQIWARNSACWQKSSHYCLCSAGYGLLFRCLMWYMSTFYNFTWLLSTTVSYTLVLYLRHECSPSTSQRFSPCLHSHCSQCRECPSSLSICTNRLQVKYHHDKQISGYVSLLHYMHFLWSCMDVRAGLWRRLSAEELMLLNCDVGEDSWQSLGLQGDLTSPF